MREEGDRGGREGKEREREREREREVIIYHTQIFGAERSFS